MNVEEIRKAKDEAEVRIALFVYDEIQRLTKASGLGIVGVTVQVIDVTSLVDSRPIHIPGCVTIEMQRI